MLLDSNKNNINTKTNIRILCAGSDRRQVFAASELSKYGKVYSYALSGEAEGARKLNSLDELDEKIDLLLLPMPCAMKLNDTLKCLDFTPYLNKNALVAGGKMSADVIEHFHASGFDTADYLRREELAVKNAVPTAEGTLAIAMKELDETINGTDVIICGWGRVAKACARLFSAAGARVCICARNKTQLAEAACLGHETTDFSRLSREVGEKRLVINTVPALVIDGKIISHMRSDCLVIDLASMPGGVDFAACGEYGIKAIHALSLPGKCAPKTAGKIIAETVIGIWQERRGTDVT